MSSLEGRKVLASRGRALQLAFYKIAEPVRYPLLTSAISLPEQSRSRRSRYWAHIRTADLGGFERWGCCGDREHRVVVRGQSYCSPPKIVARQRLRVDSEIVDRPRQGGLFVLGSVF